METSSGSTAVSEAYFAWLLGLHFITVMSRSTAPEKITQSMFSQITRERHPIPYWVVMGAGTGGTSATVGRYIRYQRYATQVCVPDPVGSVFGQYHRTGDASITGFKERSGPSAFFFLLFPIFYLVMGYLMVAVGCLIYNFAFKYLGGIEYETIEGDA